MGGYRLQYSDTSLSMNGFNDAFTFRRLLSAKSAAVVKHDENRLEHNILTTPPGIFWQFGRVREKKRSSH